jgi:signal transduction histidine kinase
MACTPPPSPPADVQAEAGEGVLRVRVRDDGCGGADLSRGSGLVGLMDRVEALGGRLVVTSPPGAGTTLEVQLPAAEARPRPAGGAEAPDTAGASTHSRSSEA